MDSSTREILMNADRSGEWEFPSDADGDNWVKIESLLTSVESIVGRSLDLDRNVQDASFLTDIGLFDDRYYDRQRGIGCIRYVFAFRFSNFGRMFTLHGEQWRQVFDEYKLGEAIELIRSNGFVYVPADQLDSPYDGINSPNNPNDGDARGTKPLMRTIPSRFEARLSDLVSKHKLSQHYDELRRDLRLGFSIHRHKGPLKTGASRFGGLPDVPRNFSWPRTAFGYLHFIAQLRFGELPAFNDDFPRRGYMLFFASMEGSTCRILWYPSVPRRLDPSVVPPHEEFSPFDAEMPIFAPQPVRFEPSMYIPPQDPSNCVDDELWWRRHQLQEDMEGPDSRLGGYAYYDPDRYGLAGGFRNWESVMQVDSFHPSSDMLWGDNGKLAFFVRRGCLKRHAFGHVSSVTLGAC